MLITIKGINKKSEGRVGVLLEDGSWMTAWNTIKKDGKRIDNPALPFLEKGAEVDVVTIENGEYINIIGINEDNPPQKAEKPKEGAIPAQKQVPGATDWNLRNMETDRGMLISYTLEHLVAKGLVPPDKVEVSKWVNHLFDLQRCRIVALPNEEVKPVDAAELINAIKKEIEFGEEKKEEIAEEASMLAELLGKIKGAKNIKELDIIKKSTIEHGDGLTDDQLTAISDAYDERKHKIVQEVMSKK